MVKCTKCDEEINYLNNYQSGENHYRLNSNGAYEFREFQGNNKVNDFECPKCGEVLFNDGDKALAFLKGED